MREVWALTESRAELYIQFTFSKISISDIASSSFLSFPRLNCVGQRQVMHLAIQFLWNDESVRRILLKDGWYLQFEEQSNALRARHPDVREESAARERLNDLGLLTSRTCRIEFQR